MLNPIPKSIHIFHYLNFGALFDFAPLVNLLELVQLSFVYNIVNIELAEFV